MDKGRADETNLFGNPEVTGENCQPKAESLVGASEIHSGDHLPVIPSEAGKPSFAGVTYSIFEIVALRKITPPPETGAFRFPSTFFEKYDKKRPEVLVFITTRVLGF